MFLDHLLNRFHQPDRLLERDDDALVVGNVSDGEGAPRLISALLNVA
jgi:hypothetical protein